MSKPIISVVRTTAGLDDYALFLSLLKSGREIVNFDDRRFAWHDAPNILCRAWRRLRRGSLGEALNTELIRYLRMTRPSHFLVFKHSLLTPEVVREAKSVGAHTVCIYPDLDPLVHGRRYVAALREFDQFFHTKPNLDGYFRDTVHPQAQLIGPFFEPAHLGIPGDVDDRIGVSFVGHHSRGKEALLVAFSRHFSGRLTIVGDRWLPSMFPDGLSDVVVRPALYGQAINDLYRRSLCSLGLLMEAVSERTSGDEITSRSVLVPAYGGVLLHAHSASAEEVFGADSPLLFRTMADAARTATVLRDHPSLRQQYAREQRERATRFGTNVDAFVREWLS